ncbi:hypothetical protein ACHWQZ_G012234 [Mnemiopsis leidyi]
MTTLGRKKISLVSSDAELQQMLLELNVSRPTLVSVDAEGWRLCRDGTLSLLALSWDDMIIYVIDVQVLGSKSFTIEIRAKNPKWSSVKELLEDPETLKVLCDPRSDSDALYHHFGVLLKNVFCVQLAEVASRRQRGYRTKYVMGGKKITLEYGGLSRTEQLEWEEIDRVGCATFFPDKGGSYDNLTRRPLSTLALSYSALGVLHLDRIYERLESVLSGHNKKWVKEESKKRVEECLLPSCNKGPHRAIPPAQW